MHLKLPFTGHRRPPDIPDPALRPIDLAGLDLAGLDLGRPEDAFEALRRVAADARPLHGELPPV